MGYPIPLFNHRNHSQSLLKQPNLGVCPSFHAHPQYQFRHLCINRLFFLWSSSNLTQLWICRKLRSELSLEDWQLGWGCLKPVTLQSVGLSQEVTSQSCKVSVFQRLSQTFSIFPLLVPCFFLQTSFWPNLKHPKKTPCFYPCFSARDVPCFHPSEAEIRLRPAPRSRVRGLGLRGHGGAAGEAWGTQRRGAVAKEGSASDGRADFSTDGAKVSSKSSRFPEILTMAISMLENVRDWGKCAMLFTPQL